MTVDPSLRAIQADVLRGNDLQSFTSFRNARTDGPAFASTSRGPVFNRSARACQEQNSHQFSMSNFSLNPRGPADCAVTRNKPKKSPATRHTRPPPLVWG